MTHCTLSSALSVLRIKSEWIYKKKKKKQRYEFVVDFNCDSSIINESSLEVF